MYRSSIKIKKTKEMQKSFWDKMFDKFCPHMWSPTVTHFNNNTCEQDCICKICGKWKTITKKLY